MWVSLLLWSSVSLVRCDETQLLFMNEEVQIQTDFFNILFYEEEGRQKACEYLEKAEVIQLEEEIMAENAYYIYTDEVLLQSKLIDEGLARVNIEFEGYLHKLQKEEVIVVAQSEKIKRENPSIWVISGLFVLCILCAFLAIKL